MSDVTGDIIVAAGPLLFLFDVNGACLAATHAGTPILSATLGEVPAWMDGKLVATGHADGMVRVWRMLPKPRSATARLDPVRAAVPQNIGALNISGVEVTPAGTSRRDPFLEAASSDAPYTFRISALLPWHPAPVTAVHVGRYVE